MDLEMNRNAIKMRSLKLAFNFFLGKNHEAKLPIHLLKCLHLKVNVPVRQNSQITCRNPLLSTAPRLNHNNTASPATSNPLNHLILILIQPSQPPLPMSNHPQTQLEGTPGMRFKNTTTAKAKSERSRENRP